VRKRIGALALLCVAFAAPASAQPPTPTLDEVEVAPGVVLFRPDSAIGNPTSIALLGDDRTILLDANLPEVVPLLREAIARRGARPVGVVVTSHAHRDHVDGLPLWLAAGASALAPDEQRQAIATSPVIQEALAAGRPALPASTFSASVRLFLRMRGEEVAIDVVRPPHRSGHTDGDALVHVPARGVLYVGDFFFLDRYPIVDVESGGSLDGYLADLDWIATSYPAETVVLPGHNSFAPAPVELPRVADLAAWAARLRASIARVEALRDEGLDLEAAVERGLGPELAPLAEKPRFVSEERWIRFVWAERARAAS